MSSARAALAACLLLAGCGGKALDPNALVKSQAQSLILAFDRKHCHAAVLYDDGHGFQRSPRGGGISDDALAWMIGANRTHGFTLRAERRNDFCILRGEYASPKDGWTLIFEGCGRPHQYGSYARLSACVATPTDIAVQDITPDTQNPKRATVIYTSALSLTSIGDILNEPASANPSGVRLIDLPGANHGALSLPQGMEYRATLQRLDATGWRVDDTTFFHPPPR